MTPMSRRKEDVFYDTLGVNRIVVVGILLAISLILGGATFYSHRSLERTRNATADDWTAASSGSLEPGGMESKAIKGPDSRGYSKAGGSYLYDRWILTGKTPAARPDGVDPFQFAYQAPGRPSDYSDTKEFAREQLDSAPGEPKRVLSEGSERPSVPPVKEPSLDEGAQATPPVVVAKPAEAKSKPAVSVQAIRKDEDDNTAGRSNASEEVSSRRESVEELTLDLSISKMLTPSEISKRLRIEAATGVPVETPGPRPEEESSLRSERIPTSQERGIAGAKESSPKESSAELPVEPSKEALQDSGDEIVAGARSQAVAVERSETVAAGLPETTVRAAPAGERPGEIEKSLPEKVEGKTVPPTPGVAELRLIDARLAMASAVSEPEKGAERISPEHPEPGLAGREETGAQQRDSESEIPGAAASSGEPTGRPPEPAADAGEALISPVTPKPLDMELLARQGWTASKDPDLPGVIRLKPIMDGDEQEPELSALPSGVRPAVTQVLKYGVIGEAVKQAPGTRALSEEEWRLLVQAPATQVVVELPPVPEGFEAPAPTEAEIVPDTGSEGRSSEQPGSPEEDTKGAGTEGAGTKGPELPQAGSDQSAPLQQIAPKKEKPKTALPVRRPSVKLKGIVGQASNYYAIIEIDYETYVVTNGDSAGGYVVSSVEWQQVTLIDETGEELLLRLEVD